MAIVTEQISFGGRQTAFRFPDSRNMRQHLGNIFGGKEYPLPQLPLDYKYGAIIDIGANVGATALWFLARAPDSPIVCFEPAKENFDCLQENLKAFSNARAFHCGLFSSDREAQLHLGKSQCMQHSIADSGETGAGRETITVKRASAEFDRLGFERVSVLKIDTEGCEVPILKDLGPDRLARVDMIFLEWHSEEDRREIDLLLSERFILASSVSRITHRGRGCYLAAPIASEVPLHNAFRIPRPPE